MNRRVVVTVTDDQGRTVSAAGVGDAIRAMEQPRPQTGGMADCCSEVLKRLDKLDDIAKALKDLADQNAALRRDLDALKQQQQVAASRANEPVQKPPTADEVAAAVAKDLKKDAAGQVPTAGREPRRGREPAFDRDRQRPLLWRVRRTLRPAGARRVPVLQGSEGRPGRPRSRGSHRPLPGRYVRQLQARGVVGQSKRRHAGPGFHHPRLSLQTGQIRTVRNVRVHEQRDDQQRRRCACRTAWFRPT